MNYRHYIFSIFFFLLSSLAAVAASIEHSGTEAEMALASGYNRAFRDAIHADIDLNRFTAIVRPVEDYARFQYLLMVEDSFGSSEVLNMRKLLAQNLPLGMKLVVLTDSSELSISNVRQFFLPWISADRLVIASGDDSGMGIWARDAFPIPVYLDEQKNVGLVQAKYFRRFTSGQTIANSVGASILWEKNFYFVGGNLIADAEGNCFVVDSDRLFELSANDLKMAFGCKDVHILPYVSGIGDVDEVIKPLPGRRMLTTESAFVVPLRGLGYDVQMLPKPPVTMGTYANALVLNDTIFMPTYDVTQDTLAKAAYERAGYRVVTVPSAEMSSLLYGSVHCMNMAYPEMSLHRFFERIHYHQVD